MSSDTGRRSRATLPCGVHGSSWVRIPRGALLEETRGVECT